MKVRNGFVSNSSSSSFIAIKPNQKHIDNIEEYIKNFMIGRYFSEDEKDEDYFKRRLNIIFNKVKDLNNFELISFDVEFGNKDTLKLLKKLDIDYIELEN